MEYFDIHNDTLVYMAFYLKRLSFPKGTLKITYSEMEDYKNLVKRSLENGKRYASYDYRFVMGAPNYNEANCTPETIRKLRATTYTYDTMNGTYQSGAESDGLSLKSLSMLSMTIRPHFYPNGYEKALNIISRRRFSNKGAKAKTAETSKDDESGQPGEE